MKILCESCLFFQQHYYIGTCALHKANCGLCKQSSKIIELCQIKHCEYFTPKIKQIEKQKKEECSIEILKHIEKLLINLKSYLKHKN